MTVAHVPRRPLFRGGAMQRLAFHDSDCWPRAPYASWAGMRYFLSKGDVEIV